jgi:hypothetical protein
MVEKLTLNSLVTALVDIPAVSMPNPPMVNSIDWTLFGKGAHLSIKGATVDSACQSKNQTMS